MPTLKRKPNTGLRTNEYQRCVVVRGCQTRCLMTCKPYKGIGPCGRPAPHVMVGRTQEAIKRQLRG